MGETIVKSSPLYLEGLMVWECCNRFWYISAIKSESGSNSVHYFQLPKLYEVIFTIHILKFKYAQI